MIRSKKSVIIIICFFIAVYFVGCPLYFSFVPDSQQEEERKKPPDVEKQDRDIGKGKKHPDGTEGKSQPPPKLEKKIPDIMSTYHRAVELDKQGKVIAAYDTYQEFIDSIPKLEAGGKVKDPHEKEERERAMEHAKKRMAELAKFKKQQQEQQ